MPSVDHLIGHATGTASSGQIVSTSAYARHMVSLSMRDRESFLAEPHVAALSVSAGQGRGPLTVPIWYQYAPGGEAWVLTDAGSRKARLIEIAGRFTLMVERVMPTVRYVSVEGPVTRMVPGTDALLREIAARYLPPDKARAYIEWAEAELGEQIAIYLRPERWLTADLGPGAVPPGVT
ncbi:MAG TPA: pyridoxamine 5'-phosphate oxidase family protein [Streptosporangiaceae bacterium]|nr:pyridoxamine 5'-phosphate oxidase family protein [Streptosporangiaceae bacterium]